MNRFGPGIVALLLLARAVFPIRRFNFRLFLALYRFSLCSRHAATARIHALMDRSTPERIRTFNEHSLDEFVIEQTFAINELIEHPRGNGLGYMLPMKFNGALATDFLLMRNQ